MNPNPVLTLAQIVEIEDAFDELNRQARNLAANCQNEKMRQMWVINNCDNASRRAKIISALLANNRGAA